MSYCSQNFYGKTSNVTISNINNVTYQGNKQEAPRGKTQQTNQGKCDSIFRKEVELIIKFSESKEVHQCQSRDRAETKLFLKVLQRNAPKLF